MHTQLLMVGKVQCTQGGRGWQLIYKQRDSVNLSTDSPHMAGGGCWNSYWFMALLSLLIGCAGLIAITYIYMHKVDNTQVQYWNNAE